jgi:hypothetical protein
VDRRLADQEIGELWRQDKPLRHSDPMADVVLRLIEKLVTELALAIPYRNWNERLSHPLTKFGITIAAATNMAIALQ